MEDAASPKHGLPACLRVPIAARGIEALQQHVGNIAVATPAYRGTVKAVCVKPCDYPVTKTSGLGIWIHDSAGHFEIQLHPPFQVWVHVDYSAYRKAFTRFGLECHDFQRLSPVVVLGVMLLCLAR
jgi:hypothetical protein